MVFDAHQLPFKDGSLAFISMLNVFHHLTDSAQFLAEAARCLAPGGPLSQANGALPWIVFCRDYDGFVEQCPSLKMAALKLHTPFAYLLSGGVSLRGFLPGFAFGPVRMLERLLGSLNSHLAMFMTVELVKDG